MPADGSIPVRKYHVSTSDECFDDFVEVATERTTATVSELVGDRRVLQQMARVIIDAHAKLAELHHTLGEARSVTHTVGLGARTQAARMEPLDEYAVVEALFRDSLDGAAETLLKAEIREEAILRDQGRG